ncbi:MAG: 3-dehydroquinate synthase II [bacterium]
MKKVWVRAIPWNKSVVTTALESGADAVMVDPADTEKVRQLGLIQTISANGDIKLGQEVVEWEIKGKKDEEEIVKLARDKMVIVRTSDWTVIPLENLIAQTEKLIAEVSDSKETETALGILEKGVDGVLINSKDPAEVKKAIATAKKTRQSMSLKTARILNVAPSGMGDRVCIDTCTMMTQGQGMLVGNSSRALFLVHSETVVNPYVEPRPFRVNAGAVHAYIYLADNKTKYLSELKAGDAVLVVNHQGKTEEAIVGRTKIEKRPLLFIQAELEGEVLTTILQNAETIRLTRPDGQPVSVIDLKAGSEVLVYIEEAGRHFGMKIKETILEK